MATEVNSQGLWDSLWNAEGGFEGTWRRYPNIYGRIEHCCTHIPKIASRSLLDVGCGVGILIDQLHKATKVQCTGVDLSEVAIRTLGEQGYNGSTIDLEDPSFELPKILHGNPIEIVTCTEVVEHLTDPQFHRLLKQLSEFEWAFISTPNNCLGPEVESQHFRKLTAKQFLDILKSYRPDFRVECYDRYCLGIAGYPSRDKGFKLSFTMPVKNEAADIERVLKSFRGVADEMVIGVDDKTTDDTKQIALNYADHVFDFTWNKDFSEARNRCMDKCTGDWIFMSEGHESLNEGVEAVLRLDEVPSYIDVIEVRREAPNCSWFFPWITRNLPNIRYKNAVHNQLAGYDDKRAARAAQISTWHQRGFEKDLERLNQRKGMNKQELLRSIRETKGKNLKAMYDLAREYSDEDTTAGFEKAIYWFSRFIDLAPPQPMRYQTRLSLGRLHIKIAKKLDKEDKKKHEKKIQHHVLEAKRVLTAASIDDPIRVEHWMILGDLCDSLGQVEFALRFYEYAAVGIGKVPSSYMFIDRASYTYLPAQKLVNAYATMGQYEDALAWAKKVEVLLPNWAPPEAFDEVRQHITTLENRVKTKETSCHVSA